LTYLIVLIHAPSLFPTWLPRSPRTVRSGEGVTIGFETNTFVDENNVAVVCPTSTEDDDGDGEGQRRRRQLDHGDTAFAHSLCDLQGLSLTHSSEKWYEGKATVYSDVTIKYTATQLSLMVDSATGVWTTEIAALLDANNYTNITKFNNAKLGIRRFANNNLRLVRILFLFFLYL
jgi:hypothetical protein